MNEIIERVGRILFALPFIVFGAGHFANSASMATMVPAYLPGPLFWVYLTGAAQIAAGISIVIRRYDRLAGLLLAGLLVVYVITVHIPGLSSPDQTRRLISFANLLKDLGLAGGALVISTPSRRSGPDRAEEGRLRQTARAA